MNRQEIDEEEFYGYQPLMDIAHWCPDDEEVKVREDKEPVCPICGQKVEPL